MRESEPIVVLGIDPGTAVTGYGVIRKDGHNALTQVRQEGLSRVGSGSYVSVVAVSAARERPGRGVRLGGPLVTTG